MIIDNLNLELVELDYNEQVDTEGGILPLIIIGAVALLASGCTQQNNNNQGGNTTNVVIDDCNGCTVNIIEADSVSTKK